MRACVFERGVLKISTNLASALRSFRQMKQPTLLWADAVCINQANFGERSQQVALMAMIFKRAVRVLGWLGEGNETTSIAMEHLRHLSALADQFSIESCEALHVKGIPRFSGTLEAGFDIADTALRKKVATVYSQAWFRRKWIAQEIALAREIVLYVGSEMIDWASFTKATSLFNGALERVETYRDKTPVRALPFIVTRILYRNTSEDAFEVDTPYSRFGRRMYVLRYLQCKDEHDHVYALMGLDPKNDPGTTVLVKPNYEVPFEQMYIAVVRRFLEDNDPTVLNDAGLSKRRLSVAIKVGPTYSGSLPTWAPELREDAIANSQIPWDFGAFHTALDIKPEISLKLPAQTRISVYGILLDAVSFKWVAPTNASHIKFFAHIKDLVGKYRSGYPITCTKHESCGEERYRFTGEELLRAFALTFALDNTDHSRRRRLRARGTGHEFLELWKGYENFCLAEQGEVHILLKQLTSAPNREQNFTDNLTAGAQLAWDFHMTVRRTLQYASCFTTTKGYMGCGPRYEDGDQADEHLVQDGDVVAIIFGMRMPSLLRRVPGSDDFQLVGPCYVQGVMKGEVKQQKGLMDAATMISLI
jgi:hypothetical protein